MNLIKTVSIKALFANIIVLALYACSKKEPTVTPTPRSPALKDMYICGESTHPTSNKTVAKFWKNGVGTFLTDGANTSSAQAISVVGRNVYIAGYEIVNLYAVVKYWKNGVATTLSDGKKQVSVSAMTVSSSNDVYVGGYEINDAAITVAKYWKNDGSSVTLGDGVNNSYIIAMASSGTDVYATGYASVGIKTLSAKLWKNGVEVPLTSDGKANSYAQAMTLVGNDVYVAGGDDTASNARVKYWKNGISTLVTKDRGRKSAAGIAVNGNDVYIAGLDSIGPKYWKNGIATNLPITKKYIRSYTSIHLVGSDVYVFGNEQDGTKKIPKYWYNGSPEFILPDIEPSAMMYGACITTE